MSKIVECLKNPEDVDSVLVIAAFREFENLRTLLVELNQLLPVSVGIIIADDSGEDKELVIETIVRESLKDIRSWLITFSNVKSGRGSAVLRGFKLSVRKFPHVRYFSECDADGSHRPVDICELVLSSDSDFAIGSRYLPMSKIVGWPISRRIASRILNFVIPNALNIRTTDITNGLRRYSLRSAQLIMSNRQTNTGFIFLSEQAILLSKNGIEPVDIPITFIDRIHGTSSVGLNEIVDSIRGVYSLYQANRQ
jgi:dolichol-phosphate mannosyltransferase